ncbi:MAG: hypothetical protein HKO62_10880 [Gammaproteobacteria bacterium]|nr:hypothetical protein [Gammaproteobacteria bacterium]NNM01244.1 hypothetical protein [Gammaproteobacteria bacterium]
MENKDLKCWKCGAALKDLPQPLARQAECSVCHADLHVCRMCNWYDTRKAEACAEPVADTVHDKTRANFCGYFDANPDAYVGSDDAAERAARASLAALFGGEAEPPAPSAGTPDDLSALFGLPGGDEDKSE